MAAEVDEAHREVTEWARTLETRVQQKSSELEAATKGLIHSEKMASLGRLAATVAHEVNNPLFGMLTYARLALKDLGRPELDEKTRARMEENLRIIERESKRCGDLMKNLLAFSRQTPPQRTQVQLNTIIERAAKLVAHQMALSRIQLEAKLDAGLPEISGDPGQLQQVVIVLLVNATEAIGEEGRVTVSTRREGGASFWRWPTTDRAFRRNSSSRFLSRFSARRKTSTGPGSGWRWRAGSSSGTAERSPC